MQVSLITPISLLQTYATRNKLQFVLAQVDNSKYKDFYLSRQRAGDTLMLDNGAYEGELVSNERLAQMIEIYHPHYVFLPDLPEGSAQENFVRAYKFFEQYKQPWYKSLFVVQGDSLVEVIRYACKALAMGVNGVAIPRNLWKRMRTSVEPLKLRYVLASAMKGAVPHLYIHALGQFGYNPLAEAALLREAGVNSIDTSGPVWRAVNDHSYFTEWPDIPLDLHWQGMVKDGAVAININCFLEAAGGEHGSR